MTGANAADHDVVDDLLAPLSDAADKPVIFGDSAYAGGATMARLEGQGFEVIARVPAAYGLDGPCSKDGFDIDLEAGTVTCPAGQVTPVRWHSDGGGTASFGSACAGCPLAERRTTNKAGRSVTVHPA